jgi:predicted nucleic acid-binding protein
MRGVYWDTSLLLKLYAVEPGSLEARESVVGADRLVVSVIAQAEIPSAFHRKVREGQWSAREVKAALGQVDLDVANGLLVFAPLTSGVWQRVRAVYGQAPGTLFLRAPDAIHLATAAEGGFASISSNDRHLLAAAPWFKLAGVNPLLP